MKIGLEVEFFGTKKGKVVNMGNNNIPHDEFPLLAEARGLPNTDVFQAVFSVKAEIEKIKSLMQSKKIVPVFTNWVEKNEQVKQEIQQILRQGIHKQISWENIYDLNVSELNETHVAAGLHISFTNERSVYGDKDVKVTYNSLFDFLKTFKKLEKEFEKEINDSKRTKGCYEIKGDGRIEYRSLPATLIRDAKFPQRLSNCLGF